MCQRMYRRQGSGSARGVPGQQAAHACTCSHMCQVLTALRDPIESQPPWLSLWREIEAFVCATDEDHGSCLMVFGLLWWLCRNLEKALPSDVKARSNNSK